jgi:hypothetical protein
MGADADRFEQIWRRFTLEMARSRTDIMTSDPNECPMPADNADAYMCMSVY